MCCLKKAFAATNLSELVTKIMSAHYIQLPRGYSEGLRSLMQILLQVFNRPYVFINAIIISYVYRSTVQSDQPHRKFFNIGFHWYTGTLGKIKGEELFYYLL